jgi:hypothetical protein
MPRPRSGSVPRRPESRCRRCAHRGAEDSQHKGFIYLCPGPAPVPEPSPVIATVAERACPSGWILAGVDKPSQAEAQSDGPEQG